MNITILSVGNKMPSWISAGYEEYAKRLSHDHKINLVELTKPQDILKKVSVVKSKNYIIALDEKGEAHTTATFAKKLDAIDRDIIFLIGAADGLDPQVREKADAVWSLSSLTFPHMMVRVILIEQIYRACSLLKNHPYHRE